MGMIIKAHIDDPAMILKINSLIKSKKYSSETNLALQAIRNLLAEEAEKARRVGKNVGHMHPYSFKDEMNRYYNAARKQGGFNELKDIEIIESNSDTAQYTKTVRIDPGAVEKLYGKKSDGLIWYWHNRILPHKARE